MMSGRSKGCGIVEFRHERDAQACIADHQGAELMGRAIFTRTDREPPRAYQSVVPPRAACQLFVGNLPFSATWQDLKSMFTSVGKVVRADVLENSEGRSRGCGVVIYETEEDALEAIKTYNGHDMNGRRLEVREDKYAGSSLPTRPSSTRHHRHRTSHLSRSRSRSRRRSHRSPNRSRSRSRSRHYKSSRSRRSRDDSRDDEYRSSRRRRSVSRDRRRRSRSSSYDGRRRR